MKQRGEGFSPPDYDAGGINPAPKSQNKKMTSCEVIFYGAA
jgi:hypothetical protein